MRRSIILCAAILVAGCSTSSKVVEALRSPPGSRPSVAQTSAPASPGPSDGAGRAIVVRAPRPEDEVVSPVTVSGRADVFEGVVSIRLLDADGQELAAMATQASCGTGCRGKFSARLAFVTQERQSGLVQVFEANAEGGPPVSLIEIPVTLVPGV